MQTESIKELAAALSKAQGQFGHAKKDVENSFFRSKYADLASVIDAAKKPLSDNGLSVVQVVDTDSEGLVCLHTMLMHVSGEWISGYYPIRPTKNDPQSVGSAITYARRYAFSAMTGIAADDDDGNAASQGKPQIDHSAAISSTKTLEALGKYWEKLSESDKDSAKAAYAKKWREFNPKQEAAQ